MSNILKIKFFSLNVKVFISFLVLGFLLFAILFLLIIPKMEKEKLDLSKLQMEQMSILIKEQVLLAAKSIDMQTKQEIQETKYKLELDILKQNNLPKECTTKLINFDKSKDLNIWKKEQIESTSFIKKDYYNLIYIKSSDQMLQVKCHSSIFNKSHTFFEKDIKKNIQKSFLLTSKIHKGISYIVWINKTYQNDTMPLFSDDKKYIISDMSNIENIHTSNLSSKQIINNLDKDVISHKLNDKDAFTWVKLLEEDSDAFLILITTTYKKDLNNKIDSIFWKILPISLLVWFLAMLAGFFILKRLFKGINILSKTAQEINKGNTIIRSNVKGNDDIGYLGIAFDSMLDLLQDNIKTLDLKVQSKTKELQCSVEEKEMLLREIHHRVKNNLALTISLIKLQQSKIDDTKTKYILKDIQERIYTMELLHRKLYESTNFNLISVNEYIKSLVSDISSTYKDIKKVKIDFDIDDISLDIETIIPCALILNEITTNAFKYAFKDNDTPLLKVSMKKEENKYVLYIKDNGKGIPSNIDIYKTKTLGLKLINSISTRQLRGEFQYFYEEGAVFRIKF